MNIADCTVTEKILLAAHQLEQQGNSPFTAEALIVTAWQKFPKTFGLKGYLEQYPDSNKILSSIMGERGLARRGWLAKMGQKVYSLTREGRDVVLRILKGDEDTKPARPVKMSRDHDRFLLNLFQASAVDKFADDRKPELTFADACRFWGITENMHGEALDTKLEKMQQQLAELGRTIGTGTTELSNGRSISMDDIANLTEINEFLEERFSRHLNLLRSRVEK